MLRRIDMVAMYVRDWPAALAFYTGSLDFTALHVEEHHHFAVLGLPDGGPTLHLIGDDARPPGSRNRCVPNVAVDDVHATVAAMRRRGVTVIEVEVDDEDGYRLARLADPEGNEINVYSLVARDR